MPYNHGAYVAHSPTQVIVVTPAMDGPQCAIVIIAPYTTDGSYMKHVRRLVGQQ